MSMNVTEAAVMRLWDAGQSREQIIRDLGIKREIVRTIISRLDVNGPEDRDREAAIRAGARRYAAALTATGKVYA